MELEFEEMRIWKSGLGRLFSWALFVHCVCLVCEGFVSRERMGFTFIWQNDKLKIKFLGFFFLGLLRICGLMM